MNQWTLRNAIRLFPSALCFALCPLLVAQQVGQFQDYPAREVTSAETLFAYRSSISPLAELGFGDVDAGRSDSLSTVPFEVPVKLTPVDSAAWANATLGSTLTFRVVNNVIVRNVFNRSSYAYVYAGTLIEAKVIRVRRGKIRTRHGRAEPRVKEVMVGKSIRLELDSSPADHRFSGIAKNVAVWSVKGPIMAVVVVLFPIEWVLLGIACSRGCDL